MKKKTNATPKATQDRVEQRRSKILKKSPAKSKPPPAKPVPGRPLAWESKSHRLEINPPTPTIVKTPKSMHLDELSTTEDEDAREATSRYVW